MISTHGNDDRHNNRVNNEEKYHFVGEVDPPESERDGTAVFPFHNHTHRMCQDLDPLLVESRRRFVLFPIQYPDVS